MTAPVVEDPRLRPLDALVAYLVARHAEDQQSVAATLAAALFPLWDLMQFRNLDTSTIQWVTVALEKVETAFLQSQRLAAVFNARVRFASLSTAPPLLLEFPQVQLPSAPISPGAFAMPELVETPSMVRLPAVIADPIRLPAVLRIADPVAVPASVADDRTAQLIARGRELGTSQWVLDRIQMLADVAAGKPSQVSVPLQEFDRADVAKTLTIEANYRTKKAMPGDELALMQDALVRSSGGAIREAMNGGRGVTARVADRDRKILGYARVTDADPCGFCAILAARGGVYGRPAFIATHKKFDQQDREQAKALGIPLKDPKDLPFGWSDIAKVHNHCQCTLRPVYTESQRQDDTSRFYEKLWRDLWDKADGSYGSPVGTMAEQMSKYEKALKANPLRQSQFDSYTTKQDLDDRVAGLLEAGFSQNAPQIKFAEGTKELLPV